MPVAKTHWQQQMPSANALFSLKSNSVSADWSCEAGKRRLKMSHLETEMMLKGYGLTTAEFFYHMPDYTHVLNSFIWQEYELAPDHPRLFQFIEFWQEKLDGPLHSVQFTHRRMLASGEWRNVKGEFTLH